MQKVLSKHVDTVMGILSIVLAIGVIALYLFVLDSVAVHVNRAVNDGGDPAADVNFQIGEAQKLNLKGLINAR